MPGDPINALAARAPLKQAVQQATCNCSELLFYKAQAGLCSRNSVDVQRQHQATHQE